MKVSKHEQTTPSLKIMKEISILISNFILTEFRDLGKFRWDAKSCACASAHASSQLSARSGLAAPAASESGAPAAQVKGAHFRFWTPSSVNDLQRQDQMSLTS